ncbi:MAG: hypothetical protein WD851_20830 [Pirellulales bacterium]
MLLTITLFLVLTILLLALVLAREVRWRRALEHLLRRILARFYPQETAHESKPPDPTLAARDDSARRL